MPYFRHGESMMDKVERMAHHSGSIEVTYTKWYKTLSILGQISVSGKKIRGIINCKRTEVWDAGQSLTSHAYATNKELFELKLRGKA